MVLDDHSTQKPSEDAVGLESLTSDDGAYRSDEPTVRIELQWPTYDAS